MMANEDGLNGDNFYKVLGVSQEADMTEIKKMYQKLVLKFHPDKFNSQTSEMSAEDARQKFHNIDQAWKTLSNPKLKAKYDASLRGNGIMIDHSKLAQEWPVNGEVDLSDMNYDEETNHYTYPCRCSGSYTITEENLEKGEDVVCCSTCTLTIQVLFCVEEGHA